jgi:hypothetical protein
MPMRYKLTAPEAQSEKLIRMTGEIGIVAVFCLTGLTLTMFVAVHLHMMAQFLVG